MALPAFFYQSKVDPGWYLTPSPPASTDLAWMQTQAVRIAPRLPVGSRQANAADLMALPVDLSWMQTTGVVARGAGIARSQGIDPSIFLAPALVPDLAWMRLRATPIAHPPPTRSHGTAPLGYLALPVDLSWNVPRPQWAPRPVTVRSQAVGIAGYLVLPVDLAWMQTHAAPPPPVPLLRSTRTDQAWFVAPAATPDLGWLPGPAWVWWARGIMRPGSTTLFYPGGLAMLHGGMEPHPEALVVITDDGWTGLPGVDTGAVAMDGLDTAIVRLY